MSAPELWERSGGTWINCQQARELLDAKLGEGVGLNALFRRLHLDKVGVRANNWEYWADARSPSHIGVRRAALRNLHRQVGKLSAGDLVEIESRNDSLGDYTGRCYVLDDYDGSAIIDDDDVERKNPYLAWRIIGLHFMKEDICRAFDIDCGTVIPVEPISTEDLEAWIKTCGTENSKEAWRALRAAFGSSAPKRDEVFMPAWRKVKGPRKQGRIKSPA